LNHTLILLVLENTMDATNQAILDRRFANGEMTEDAYVRAVALLEHSSIPAVSQTGVKRQFDENKLAHDARVLICGKKQPRIYLFMFWWGLAVLIIGVLWPVMLAFQAAYPEQKGTSKRVFNLRLYRVELLKQTYPTLPLAIIAFIGAFTYTQFRQRKEIAFKLIEELNSPGFEEIRSAVVKLAQRAGLTDHEGRDVDIININMWFPLTSPPPHVPPRSQSATVTSIQIQNVDQPAAFSEAHAFQKMVYFVYRVHLYDKHQLLDRSVTRQMFHAFFAHYQVLLLEFAKAFTTARRQWNADGLLYQKGDKYLYNDREWDMLPEGIEKFFNVIGLGSKLDDRHTFVYFPSENARSAIAAAPDPAPGQPTQTS
jgi:hypothetical protein